GGRIGLAQSGGMGVCGGGLMIGGGKVMARGEDLQKTLLRSRDQDLSRFEASRIRYRKRAGAGLKWSGLVVLTIGTAVALGSIGAGNDWPDKRALQDALLTAGLSAALAGSGMSVLGHSLQRENERPIR